MAGGTRRRTGWWKSVVEEVTGDEGGWFWDNIELAIDGKKADFWEGMWSGSRSLKEQFPRLFMLRTKKDGRVADMGGWEDGGWRWKLEWRRALRDNEKAWEGELSALFQHVVPVDGQREGRVAVEGTRRQNL